MSNVILVTAIRRKLQDLSLETNHKERQVIDKFIDFLNPLLLQWRHFMEDADANHNITEYQANNFRAFIRICCNLEDFIESYTREIASRRNRNRLQNMISKRSSWQQIKELAEIISSIPSPAFKTSEAGTTDPPEEEEQQQQHQYQAPLETVAVENEETTVKSLVSALSDMDTSHLNMVCVCGMPGIGKTTLARQLYEKPLIKAQFEVRAWVCVSPELKSKRVFREILAVTSETWFERREGDVDMSEVDLAELVYKSLKERRYLIVLDDIWTVDAWLSLRMAFRDDNNGSRVLITTRIMDVANQVGGHIHTMRPLSEQETWDLVRLKLNLNERQFNSRSELKLIRGKIARLCGGLPSSVDIIAGLLSKKPCNEWKELVEQLSVSGVPTDGRVHDVIGLSYKHLPLQLRPCLLYLGNFPKDRDIELDTICQLWIAEGLISMENIGNGEKMMDVAERYLDELANRSLVIIQDKFSRQRRFKSCSIHDSIREYCETKGKQGEFSEVLHLRNENQNMSSSVIRRAIHLDKYEYTRSHLYGNINYLRSLLFFTSYKSEEGMIRPREIPKLDYFIWLRVLYLYGVDFTDGKLPKGVEKLVYLRYLGFRECYLEDLSSLVGNMCYLQTLDLRVRNECEMAITNVFNGFKRLKYLYFPLAYRSFNHKEKLHLGELKELEILDNFDTSLCNIEDLRGLTNLQELKVTTEGDVSEIEKILEALENNTSRFRSISLNIRHFNCHSSKRFSAMENVFKSSALHVLEVQGHLGKLPVFDRASSKLTEVILSGSQLVEDPMQILQDLPNLAILALETEAYIGDHMKCASSGFRKLRYLKLLKLYRLKYWDLDDGALSSLLTLVIENCQNLEMLPDGLEYCQLQKLEIVSMPGAFVGRIQMSDGTEGEDFYKIEYVQTNVKIDGQHLILKEE